MRIGALVKALFKDVKASSTVGDQERGLGLFLSRFVSGLVIVIVDEPSIEIGESMKRWSSLMVVGTGQDPPHRGGDVRPYSRSRLGYHQYRRGQIDAETPGVPHA